MIVGGTLLAASPVYRYPGYVCPAGSIDASFAGLSTDRDRLPEWAGCILICFSVHGFSDPAARSLFRARFFFLALFLFKTISNHGKSSEVVPKDNTSRANGTFG